MIPINSLKQYIDIIDKALTLGQSLKTQKKDFLTIINQIIQVQKTVNKNIFFTENFSAISYHESEIEHALEEPDVFLETVTIWKEIVLSVSSNNKNYNSKVDEDFMALMTYYSISESGNILMDMQRNFLALSADIRTFLCDKYTNNSYMWGALDFESGNFEVFNDRISVIKNYEKDFIWLYERLGDFRSKVALFQILKNWLTFSQDDLKVIRDKSFPDYCDYDILGNSIDGVYVDCGAFNGDTVINFSEYFRNYKHIYAFEASPSTFSELEKNTSDIDNVTLINKAVGKEAGTIFIGDDGEAAGVLKGGTIPCEMVSLDEEIKETISIVKMDIEGAEKDSLQGMKNHIEKEKPKLVICVYHGNHDIIEVPIIISNIRDDYKYYLRYNGVTTHPIDFVLYAV